ncbi:MAG: hypothetical protein V7603_4957 [Micromonosporaceae bacterium]
MSTLVVATATAPSTLDITAPADAATAEALRDNVYEGPVQADSGGRILPQLARE